MDTRCHHNALTSFNEQWRQSSPLLVMFLSLALLQSEHLMSILSNVFIFSKDSPCSNNNLQSIEKINSFALAPEISEPKAAQQENDINTWENRETVATSTTPPRASRGRYPDRVHECSGLLQR